MSCFTFLPLHFGQQNFFFSYSATVTVSVNFFLHFSHMNSYVGMANLLRYVKAYNYRDRGLDIACRLLHSPIREFCQRFLTHITHFVKFRAKISGQLTGWMGVFIGGSKIESGTMEGFSWKQQLTAARYSHYEHRC